MTNAIGFDFGSEDIYFQENYHQSKKQYFQIPGFYQEIKEGKMDLFKEIASLGFPNLRHLILRMCPYIQSVEWIAHMDAPWLQLMRVLEFPEMVNVNFLKKMNSKLLRVIQIVRNVVSGYDQISRAEIIGHKMSIIQMDMGERPLNFAIIKAVSGLKMIDGDTKTNLIWKVINFNVMNLELKFFGVQSEQKIKEIREKFELGKSQALRLLERFK